MKGSNYANDPKTQYYSVIYSDDKRTDPWYTALEVEHTRSHPVYLYPALTRNSLRIWHAITCTVGMPTAEVPWYSSLVAVRVSLVAQGTIGVIVRHHGARTQPGEFHDVIRPRSKNTTITAIPKVATAEHYAQAMQCTPTTQKHIRKRSVCWKSAVAQASTPEMYWRRVFGM